MKLDCVCMSQPPLFGQTCRVDGCPELILELAQCKILLLQCFFAGIAFLWVLLTVRLARVRLTDGEVRAA